MLFKLIEDHHNEQQMNVVEKYPKNRGNDLITVSDDESSDNSRNFFSVMLDKNS